MTIELTPSEKKLILDRRKILKHAKLLKCPSCSHCWPYKGSSDSYVSCPKCHYGAVHVYRHRVEE